jgi:WD40 repeat protein
VARVAGLKSGRVLRELRGHASFVLAVAYTPDGGTLVTGSADGTLRTWDARTGEAGLAVVPPRAATARAGAPDAPVVAVLPHPTDPGVVVVATRAPCLHIVNVASGAILATLATGKADGGDVVAAALSSRGGFAHALAEDGVLYSFNTGTRLLDGVLTVVEAGADGKLPPPIGVACHPGRNVAATWGADGSVTLWDAGSGGKTSYKKKSVRYKKNSPLSIHSLHFARPSPAPPRTGGPGARPAPPPGRARRRRGILPPPAAMPRPPSHQRRRPASPRAPPAAAPPPRT